MAPWTVRASCSDIISTTVNILRRTQMHVIEVTELLHTPLLRLQVNIRCSKQPNIGVRSGYVLLC